MAHELSVPVEEVATQGEAIVTGNRAVVVGILSCTCTCSLIKFFALAFGAVTSLNTFCLQQQLLVCMKKQCMRVPLKCTSPNFCCVLQCM